MRLVDAPESLFFPELDQSELNPSQERKAGNLASEIQHIKEPLLAN